jgi:hypothetical protein
MLDLVPQADQKLKIAAFRGILVPVVLFETL